MMRDVIRKAVFDALVVYFVHDELNSDCNQEANDLTDLIITNLGFGLAPLRSNTKEKAI